MGCCWEKLGEHIGTWGTLSKWPITHTHTHNCSSSQALVASSKFGLHFELEKVKLRNNPMKFGVIKLKNSE